MAITQAHRQENLCLAYVQAVAAECGLSYSIRNLDYGIDLTLCEVLRIGQEYFESGFRVDLQLKTTTRFRMDDEYVYYDLSVRAYEQLRDPEGYVPRLLVTLVLPSPEKGRLTVSEESLVIHGCAYWLSLQGEPPTSNRRTVRVALPRENGLTVSALEGIFERTRRGDLL